MNRNGVVSLVRMWSEVVSMGLQNKGRRLVRSADEHSLVLDATRSRVGVAAERLARGHLRNAAAHRLREDA